MAFDQQHADAISELASTRELAERMRERSVKARNALVEILAICDHANVREIAVAALKE